MKIDSTALAARGKSVCQDYVLHGDDFVIVADGCSSSPFSNVGAMLLAHQSRALLAQFERRSYWAFGELVIDNAAPLVRQFDLPLCSLDATLLIGKKYEHGIRVRMYGDGIFWESRNQSTEIHGFEMRSKDGQSLPFYLRYLLEGLQQYFDRVEFLTEKIISEDVETVSVNPLRDAFILDRTFHSCDLVGLASDGLLAISNKQGQNVSIAKAVQHFTEFPCQEGNFLARRLWATVRREGWNLGDDLGMGVLLCK